MELTRKNALKIVPFMLSSVAVPVIGAVDTAVVGRLGSPDYISAVAGAVIFSTIYWLLGFLRITTGMTAQAVGEKVKKFSSYYCGHCWWLLNGVAV